MATEFDSSYTDYQLNRSFLRKVIRRMYLRRAATQLRGRTLDFGCGVGELLAYLPVGSKGLEYNKATVEFCQNQGLPVSYYDGMEDNWSLSCVSRKDNLESMVISHVLEHLDQPMAVLNRLLDSAIRIGVDRVLIIVPGRAGYKIDSTHHTFVDEPMLRSSVPSNWAVSCHFYFPLNVRRAGDIFVYNELHFLLEPVGSLCPIMRVKP